MTSSVWANLAVSKSIQWGIPYIDGNSLSPDIDAGTSNLLVNFGYKTSMTYSGAGAFSVGTFGDLTGTDPINSGGQVDSYIPIVNQAPASLGGVPGHSVSVSRGTRLLPLIVGTGDFIGEFSGYGYVGATPTFGKLAAINYYVSGADANLPGGEMRFGTTANATGVFTEYYKLDNTGKIAGLRALVAGGDVNNCICLTLAGTGPAIYSGSGLPTIVAAKGSMYLRSDGSSTTTRMYINTDGAATWTNVITTA